MIALAFSALGFLFLYIAKDVINTRVLKLTKGIVAFPIYTLLYIICAALVLMFGLKERFHLETVETIQLR